MFGKDPIGKAFANFMAKTQPERLQDAPTAEPSAHVNNLPERIDAYAEEVAAANRATAEPAPKVDEDNTGSTDEANRTLVGAAGWIHLPTEGSSLPANDDVLELTDEHRIDKAA